MIKLKSLLKEYDEKKGLPDQSLADHITQHNIVTISDWLYHGSPYDGLQSMIIGGVSGTEHGEVAELDTLSTSVNSEVLDYFSEGDGTTGLQFNVQNAKVVVLDDILTFLVTQLPGSGMSAEVDNEEEFEIFCQKFNIPVSNWKHTPYLPYGYLSSLGVDAFMYDYVWRNYQRGHMPFRDESEVCFIGKRGMDMLNKSITGIWVDGEEFEISQKHDALKMIQKKI